VQDAELLALRDEITTLLKLRPPLDPRTISPPPDTLSSGSKKFSISFLVEGESPAPPRIGGIVREAREERARTRSQEEDLSVFDHLPYHAPLEGIVEKEGRLTPPFDPDLLLASKQISKESKLES